MTKTELRQVFRNLLRGIPAGQRKQRSETACRNLVKTEQFKSASTVMIYLALEFELDTCAAIDQAWQMGKTVAVPRIYTNDRSMVPVRVDSWDQEFSIDAFGLRNPVSQQIIDIENIDLVVVPALGYDFNGNRLGRGCAYYDRFLVNSHLKAATCGFAFSEQVIDFIPTCETDYPVDFLVTDKRIVHLRAS
jgi:5-formyltetrahydrofolate cyclo-ligase